MATKTDGGNVTMKLSILLLLAALAAAQSPAPTPTPVPLVIRSTVALPGATYNLYRLTPNAGVSGCVALAKPYPAILASGSLATSPVTTSDAPGYGVWCYYATESINGAESLPSAPYSVTAASPAPTLGGQ